jgi:hypothetical protein
MNDNWNYNMNEAPRGQYVSKIINGPKGPIKTQIYEHDLIIATDGDIVTLSRWLPPITDGPVGKQRDGRWTMFGVNQTPVAWQHWPKPPSHVEEKP